MGTSGALTPAFGDAATGSWPCSPSSSRVSTDQTCTADYHDLHVKPSCPPGHPLPSGRCANVRVRGLRHVRAPPPRPVGRGPAGPPPTASGTELIISVASYYPPRGLCYRLRLHEPHRPRTPGSPDTKATSPSRRLSWSTISSRSSIGRDTSDLRVIVSVLERSRQKRRSRQCALRDRMRSTLKRAEKLTARSRQRLSCPSLLVGTLVLLWDRGERVRVRSDASLLAPIESVDSGHLIG